MGDTLIEHKFKLVLVGDSSVGKSSIIKRFGSDQFPESQNATIGVDFIVKNIIIDGTNVKLQIWDTAGQERFRTIITGYYRGADAVIFVFDKSIRDTFDHIDDWVTEVSQYSIEKAIKVIVGNKSDLESQVTNEEAHSKAKKFGFQYFDVSARSDLNVKVIFEKIAEGILHRNKMLGINSYVPTRNISLVKKEEKKGICC